MNAPKYEARAEKTGGEARGGTQAVFWRLRLNDDWTVPLTELTRGDIQGTAVVIADAGRKSAAKDIEELLAQRQRVLALDPTFIGEASMGGRTYLHALLAATVGQRSLGIEAAEVNAVARWAAAEFKAAPTVHSTGPRTGLVALVAKALEPDASGTLKPAQHIEDLHGILRNNWSVQDKPEMFCFGLLEHFNVPRLRVLAGQPRQ